MPEVFYAQQCLNSTFCFKTDNTKNPKVNTVCRNMNKKLNFSKHENRENKI